MTARSEVTALLDKGLPSDVDVIAYAHDIEAPVMSTVMVQTDSVTPGVVQGTRTYEITLTLIAMRTTFGTADDELDALLEDVLFALEDNATPAGITWTDARRTTYEETNPAYQVTLAVTMSKE